MPASIITRRLAHLRKTLLHALACLALCLCAAGAARAQNPTAAENAKPGTSGWQLTNPAMNREIEGYASLTSVNRGGQITLFVNTAETAYTIEVFRMGWYGGVGARRVLGPVQRTGAVQPVPTTDPATGLVECRWTNGYVVSVPNTATDPTDWASGVYLAKLTAGTSGKQSYIMFVVRDDARASTLLFQQSVTTYQAYNNWGGKSLYNWNSTSSVPARKVSFNRPYAVSPNPAAAYGVGAGEFITNVQPGPEAYFGISSAGWEYNMVRFLEREGYDATYNTNVDTHALPSTLLTHKAFLSVGHDEYWSWDMRANVEAARDRGVGLAFFSANTCYWQIRFEPGAANAAPNRTMVGYRANAEAEDPMAKDADTANDKFITTQWRNNTAKPPEEALLGVMYAADPVDADIVIEDSTHWACANTGLRNGDHLPGLLGYEVDRMYFDYPGGTARIATSPFVKNGVTDDSHMVTYTAASGATVFATGSIQWAWGLDDYNAPLLRTSRLSAAAQHMTRNVLARMAGLPPPTPPAATPTPTPVPTQLVFGDDFNDNLLDASKWALGTIQGAIYSGPAAWDSLIPAREQNGRLEITPRTGVAGDHYNGYVTSSARNMSGAAASVEVVSVSAGGATDTQLAVCVDSQNFYMIVYEGGSLHFQDAVSGARTSFSILYDAAQQRFWRIRHDPQGDLMVFETSPDRLAWTVRRSVPRQLPLASMKVELSAGTWRAETTTGTTVFDNFRLDGPGGTPSPTPTPTPTPAPTPTPTPVNKPPVANPGGPYTGTTSASIKFDGTRSSDPDGSVASYRWDFGDGTTANGSAPSKTYAAAGVYAVRLTVTDNKGATASATTTATVNLLPPSEFNATTLDQSRIRLTWKDNSKGELGFKIERSTSATGVFSQIGTVGTGVTSFTNSGLPRTTTYYYRVRAYGNGINSAYSNVDSARTN